MQTIDRIVSVMHVPYNNLYLDQNTMLCLCNVWTQNNIHFFAAFLCYTNVYEYGSVLIMLIVVTEFFYRRLILLNI